MTSIQDIFKQDPDIITAAAAIPYGHIYDGWYLYDFKKLGNDYDFRSERYGAAAWDENGNLTWCTAVSKPLKIVEYAQRDYVNNEYLVPEGKKYAFIYLGHGHKITPPPPWGLKYSVSGRILTWMSPTSMHVYYYSHSVNDYPIKGTESSPPEFMNSVSFLSVDVTDF